MPYVDEVRLQGTIYSGKSCEFDFGFGAVEGCLKASGDEKRERKVVHGSRRDGRPIGLTAGKVEPGKFTCARRNTTAEMLFEYLTASGLGSIGDAIIPITVSTFEPDSSDIPQTITFDNCALTSKKQSWDEGIDELVTEIEFQPIGQDQNAQVLYSIIRNI
jgi:hypothetical protein